MELKVKGDKNMSKTVKNIIAVILVFVCLFLIVSGQRTICLQGLIKEIVGLVGLLVLLYLYNRQYK